MTSANAREILVADDDGVMRNLLHALLTHAGYRVHLATDGEDALAQCGRHGASPAPASLALLDMSMPNRDGISTCRSLRALPGWRHVPIIMVTSNGTDRAVRAAMQAGIDGFVVKPFSAQDLLQRVSHWVNGQTQNQNQPGPTYDPGAAGDDALAAGHIMPGVSWNIGRHSLGSPGRGETGDIGHLLRGRSGLLPL
jgi:CheY-like chemotaxis protein